MAPFPDERKYTRGHEWARPTGDGRVRIGVTDFAQRQPGDIVHVERPKAGDTFEASEPFGSVEWSSRSRRSPRSPCRPPAKSPR
ncbi:glycine cleavage system protein H [Streptomyces sp. SP18CS02]|uniref:glycine cleavage system protein H n=1 Tax=Streptomyces sp. SP18CS02 TaxID=3002531 RepID=UPI003FCD6A53